MDGNDHGSESISRSHFPAVIARCAVRCPFRTFSAVPCVFVMAPRKYLKFGEEAKAAPTLAKAKASQARSTPSPKGKVPATGDPKAFPPVGAAGGTRPPPPPVPKSFASSGVPPAAGGVAKAGSSGDPPAVLAKEEGEAEAKPSGVPPAGVAEAAPTLAPKWSLISLSRLLLCRDCLRTRSHIRLYRHPHCG